jgi:hypothetical protein
MIELWICLRAFVLAHRKFLSIWTTTQIILTSFFIFTEHFFADNGRKSLNAVFLIAYCASFYAFVMYLGIAFNTHRKQSWIRQLPFRESTLLLTPILIMGTASLWYFSTLYNIWHKGYFNGISSVEFLVLIPTLNFLLIRKARRPLMGGLIGGVLTLVILFFQASILGRWIQENYGLFVEVHFWIALVVVTFIIERNHPIAAIVTGVLSAILPSVLLLRPYLSNPNDFLNIVADVKLYPSPAAVENFRKFATNGAQWRQTPGVYAYRRRVNRESQIFARKFLTNAEIGGFLTNILSHSENFAIIEPYTQKFPGPDSLPLHPKDLSPEAKRYLSENWKDDEAHCHFLGHDLDEDLVRIALASEACGSSILGFFRNQPYPHLEPTKAALLDLIVQAPRDGMSREIRNTIEAEIQNFSSFPPEIESLFTKNNWFKTAVFPDAALVYFRKYYRAEDRKQIQTWIKRDRAGFVTAILEASQRRVEREHETKNMHSALKYLCLNISTNCDGEVPTEERGDFLYIAKSFWRTQVSSRNEPFSETQFQLAQEILKPENWNTIKNLEIR